MRREFVVISGLPGSGKTTLGQRLASALNLPLIDKDEILESLFEAKGSGDAAWRRALSRESDEIFKERALRAGGAILSSFWHLAGMPHDSGTPTAWLNDLDGQLVHVRCICRPAIAAERFLQRTRHPGHLDHEKDAAKLLASIEALAALPPVDIVPRIDIDTAATIGMHRVAREVQAALGHELRDIRYQAAIVHDNHLLIAQVTLQNGHRFWLLPGGGREPADASAEECVAREVREETTLEVKVERLLSDAATHPDDPGYERLHTYLCRIESGVARAGSLDGSAVMTGMRWLALDDDTGWGADVRTDAFLYPQLLQIREALKSQV